MSQATAAPKMPKALVADDHLTMRSLLLEMLITRTQAEAAKVLGISQPTFSSIFQTPPKYRLGRKLARKVAKRLGVDEVYFCKLACSPIK